jgi:hypothetical protein
MFATFIGIVFAILLNCISFFHPLFETTLMVPQLAFELAFSLSLFLSLKPWIWTLHSLIPSKKSLVSNVQNEAVLHDIGMYLYSSFILVFSFSGLIIVSQPYLSPIPRFAFSFILFGLIIDALRRAYHRFHERRSAAGVGEWIVSVIKRSIFLRNEQALLECYELVFSLFVGYIKSGDVRALKLFSVKLVSAVDTLLAALPKLTLFHSPSQEETLLDRYLVMEAIGAKRIAWAVKVSCEEGDPTALEETMRLAGRLFLSFHNHHESLGHVILSQLSQTMQSLRMKHADWEKDPEVTTTFSEIIKTLIDRSLQKQVSEISSILRILALLEWYMKESFRRDKSINPALLMQPFAEVGELLAATQYNALLNRDEILAELKRILAQFSILETVAERFDSGLEGSDTKATYHEDLPFSPTKEKL